MQKFSEFLAEAKKATKKKSPSLETTFGKHSKQKSPVLETVFGKHSQKQPVSESLQTDYKINYAGNGLTTPAAEHEQSIDDKMHAAAPFHSKTHNNAVTYTEDSSDVNSMLHAHHNEDFDKFEKLARSPLGLLTHVRGLDKELDKASTTEDMSVYTGIRRSPFPHFEGKSGSVYMHLPSYTSTSPSFHIAASFARGFDAYGEHTPKAAQEQHGLNIPQDHSVHHVLKLNMPKGTKAASLRDVSIHSDESEILMHRGHEVLLHPRPQVVTSGKQTHLIWNADVVEHDPAYLPRSINESIQESIQESNKTIQCGIGIPEEKERLVEAIEGFPIDHEQHKNVVQGFTQPAKAREALGNYSVTSLRMNAGLWAAHHNVKNLAPRHHIENINQLTALDDAFKRAKSKAPATVFTGVRDSVFDKFDADGKTVAHHPAFLSTSTAPNIALNFAYHDTKHQAHMLSDSRKAELIKRHQLPENVFDKRIRHVVKIDVPAGSKAISLANGVSKNTHEHEILLHRGHDIEIDPIPHSIHPESFTGVMDKAHVIVWNARLAGHKPMKIKSTLNDFLEEHRSSLIV